MSDSAGVPFTLLLNGLCSQLSSLNLLIQLVGRKIKFGIIGFIRDEKNTLNI